MYTHTLGFLAPPRNLCNVLYSILYCHYIPSPAPCTAPPGSASAYAPLKRARPSFLLLPSQIYFSYIYIYIIIYSKIISLHYYVVFIFAICLNVEKSILIKLYSLWPTNLSLTRKSDSAILTTAILIVQTLTLVRYAPTASHPLCVPRVHLFCFYFCHLKYISHIYIYI